MTISNSIDLSHFPTPFGIVHSIQEAMGPMDLESIGGINSFGVSVPSAMVVLPNDLSASIDESDNDSQSQVVKHLYENLEDENEYTKDAVIHQVLNDVPTTYRGKNGIHRALLTGDTLLHSLKEAKSIHIDHFAVNHNHAQVTWSAETSHKILVGTDYITFDDTNHITCRTIVALTQGDK
jgi:hypothetical protein